MNKFAVRLKEVREDKGVTQLQLADFMNTKQQTISKWEKKLLEPPYDSVVKLCKYFDCTADYLLGLTDY